VAHREATARLSIERREAVGSSLHAVREFEAESVSHLVCSRLGIDTASDEYLAAYIRKCPATPPISLDRIMKSVWLLEQMGRERLREWSYRTPPLCPTRQDVCPTRGCV